MKIGVLSDTHSLAIPSRINEIFAGSDLIIHAGDICEISVIKKLQAIAPVSAVQGNMDNSDIKNKFPMTKIIDVGDVHIGVCHGHIGPKDALMNAQAHFYTSNVDVVIFGHSHHAFNEMINGVLYFNPGSPNDVVKAKFFSCGVLFIKGQTIKGEIIKI